MSHDGGLRLDVVFDHMLLTKGGGGRHQHESSSRRAASPSASGRS
jgi:hypothetical protein